MGGTHSCLGISLTRKNWPCWPIGTLLPSECSEKVGKSCVYPCPLRGRYRYSTYSTAHIKPTEELQVHGQIPAGLPFFLSTFIPLLTLSFSSRIVPKSLRQCIFKPYRLTKTADPCSNDATFPSPDFSPPSTPLPPSVCSLSSSCCPCQRQRRWRGFVPDCPILSLCKFE